MELSNAQVTENDLKISQSQNFKYLKPQHIDQGLFKDIVKNTLST